MRRNFLHISLALLTFTIGFLSSGTSEGLTAALIVALIVFVSLQKITRLNLNLHHLKVALLTLLIWIPIAGVILNAMPQAGSCMVEFSDEEMKSFKEADKNEEVIVTTEPKLEMYPVISGCNRRNTNDVTVNTIWAGIVDDKALIKPAPFYPPLAKSAGISSIVAVAVVIEPTGKVVEAEAISGHPLLRQAAVEAAYKARFEPIRICGISVNVSGILTYRFGL